MAVEPVRSDRDEAGREGGGGEVGSTRLLIPASTMAKFALFVLLTLGVLWVISSLGDVLLVIMLAVVVAAILSAPVGWLERRGLGRGISAVLSLLGVLVIVAGVVALVLPPLIQEVSQLVDNLPATVEQLRGRLRGNQQLYDAVTRQVERLRDDPSELLTGAVQFGFGVASTLFVGVLLLTLALYFVVDGDRVRAAVLRLTPREYRAQLDETFVGTGAVIRSYFIGQTIVSAIFAIFTFILLTALGVPYASVFAALAFFFDAIPNIGATLATILPGLVALTQSVTTAIIVVAAIMVYQQVESNFIAPRVLGGKLKVPPVATLIAILAGAKLLGIVGVVLAVPIAGTLPVLERIWITRGREEAPPEERTPPEAEQEEAA